ncbi:hypothetical protein AB0L50_30750 [Streptomyces flaveolus]|uniref:hypothetical protein n=1 Tax=Streptomyces flaveolus TaxID=67297 RepID=UPI003420535E
MPVTELAEDPSSLREDIDRLLEPPHLPQGAAEIGKRRAFSTPLIELAVDPDGLR